MGISPLFPVDVCSEVLAKPNFNPYRYNPLYLFVGSRRLAWVWGLDLVQPNTSLITAPPSYITDLFRNNKEMKAKHKPYYKLHIVQESDW